MLAFWCTKTTLNLMWIDLLLSNFRGSVLWILRRLPMTLRRRCNYNNQSDIIVVTPTKPTKKNHIFAFEKIWSLIPISRVKSHVDSEIKPYFVWIYDFMNVKWHDAIVKDFCFFIRFRIFFLNKISSSSAH